MKLRLTEDENGIRLPAAALDLLADTDETDLRVLLFAAGKARFKEAFDTAEAAASLSLPESEVKASVKLWRGAGVLTAADAKGSAAPQKEKKLRQKQAPDLSSDELCAVANENADFRRLLDMAQQTAGWIFNTSEIGILAGLYATLHLSPEFILSLISYYICKREKNLRYTETVAYDLVDRGIDTPEALEAHLQALEQFESREGTVRKLFGLGTRKLSAKEAGYLSDWFEKYGFTDDVIELAFEKTVNATGKASLSYANSILRAWHEAGVRTAADAAASDKKPTESKKPKSTAKAAKPQSFDADEFLRTALTRSYGKTEEV